MRKDDRNERGAPQPLASLRSAACDAHIGVCIGRFSCVEDVGYTTYRFTGGIWRTGL